MVDGNIIASPAFKWVGESNDSSGEVNNDETMAVEDLVSSSDQTLDMKVNQLSGSFGENNGKTYISPQLGNFVNSLNNVSLSDRGNLDSGEFDENQKLATSYKTEGCNNFVYTPRGDSIDSNGLKAFLFKYDVFLRANSKENQFNHVETKKMIVDFYNTFIKEYDDLEREADNEKSAIKRNNLKAELRSRNNYIRGSTLGYCLLMAGFVNLDNLDEFKVIVDTTPTITDVHKRLLNITLSNELKTAELLYPNNP